MEYPLHHNTNICNRDFILDTALYLHPFLLQNYGVYEQHNPHCTGSYLNFSSVSLSYENVDKILINITFWTNCKASAVGNSMYVHVMPTVSFIYWLLLHIDGSTSTKSPISQLQALPVLPVYPFLLVSKIYSGILYCCYVSNTKITTI